MKYSLPICHQIQTTTITHTGSRFKPPKYLQSDSIHCGFLLDHHVLWAYQKDQHPVQLGNNILEIDYDDNMLLSLTLSGEIIVWQGDLHDICTPDNVQEFSRLLFTIPNFIPILDTNYMICFRGSVGLICILNNLGSFFLIKVDIDLSIPLYYTTNISLKDAEEIETCAIWGDETMLLVYTQTNQVFVGVLIDASNSNSPYLEVLRCTSSYPITCLCHESKEISTYGDSNGGITLWNITSDQLLEKVLTVHSFIHSGITSLHLAGDNIIWIGGSDGTIVSSYFNIQKENPIILKLSMFRLHSLSAYSTYLRWYPSDLPELNGLRFLSNVPKGDKKLILSGFIVTICFVTGEISSLKLTPCLNSIIGTNPFPTTVWTIPPLVGHLGNPFSNCYQDNIELILYFPSEILLLVCNSSSQIDLWNPITSEFIQSIDLMESPMRSFLLEGKITIMTLLSEEIQLLESQEVGQKEQIYLGTILIGLITGSVWNLVLRRKVSSVRGNDGASRPQNSNRYSVLDMMDSLSVIETPNLIDEKERDGSQSSLSRPPKNEDSLITLPEGQSSTLYHVSCTRIDPRAPIIPQSSRKQPNLSLFPPIPVTDIFVSSGKNVICVIHSRCSFSIYSLSSSQMIRSIDLNSTDHVVEICASTTTAEKENLIIGILGKENLKILDIIQGSHLYDIVISDLPIIPSTEKVVFSQIISLCPNPMIPVMESNQRAIILLTSTGNLYFFHNLSNPRPIQLFDSESILFQDRDDAVEDRNVDYLSCIPMRFDHYFLPIFNSRSVLIIQAFRVLIILLLDFSKHPYHPQISKFSKIEFDTIPSQRRRILTSYPIELDWKNEVYKILVVMSDGSTFILTV